MTIGEVGHDPFLTPAPAKLLKTQNMPANLHIGHCSVKFVDMIDSGTVHIFVGIVFQQVTPSADAQFALKNGLSLRAYPGQIHDVLT